MVDAAGYSETLVPHVTNYTACHPITLQSKIHDLNTARRQKSNVAFKWSLLLRFILDSSQIPAKLLGFL
jgi:hypothetical protein